MDYDLKLYTYLKNNLKTVYLSGRKDETIIRCPFCGDSLDLNHAHFYINNNPPFKFFCQKCETTGIFNNKILNMLNLFDNEISNYLNKSFTEFKLRINIKYGNSYFNYFKNNKKLVVFPKSFNDLEMKKVEYIENRLGFFLNDNDIENFKIITNLQDFVELNDINIVDDSIRKKIYILNKYSLGFLLNDCNTICCRYLNPLENQPRYINFKLFEEEVEFSRKFFTIKNEIDISNNKFNINLAEGCFDIISIFKNVYNNNKNDNDVFVAVNGKSYSFALNYFMRLGILNTDINIYSDSDVKNNFYKKIKNNNLLCKFNGINLYYNKLGKDYGVDKDKIELTSPLIL